MHLVERPEASVATRIDADAAAVWQVISDIDTPARFSDEFQGGEWLDGVSTPSVGARFRGHNERGGYRWTVTCTVTACEVERAFEWVVGELSDPIARWRFDITVDDEAGPTPVGGVRLQHSCEMGTATSGLTAAIERAPEREEQIVAARMARHRESMANTINGIKALIEA